MDAAARRICLCTASYPPQPGGVAVASARLARHLAAAGYEVHVVAPVARDEAQGEVEVAINDGVLVHRMFHQQPWGQAGLFALRRFIGQLDQEAGFALFHGFFLPAAYPCLGVATRGVARPVIASIRGSDVTTLLDQPSTRALLLPVLRGATWITSVNEECLALVAAQVPIAGRQSVIRSGVERPADEARWSLTNMNRGVVGTVGEFRKVKDIPLLIRAYAALPRGVRSGLWLAGFFADAEEEAWSTDLIGELSLADEVVVTGPFPNAEVGTHLRRMHVYVQSSAHEGLPNALLEAAARGVPIVATAVGGMKEVLVHGESALLVPHGDRDALMRAIGSVLADDALAQRLSDGARALARALSPERERDAWLALYRQVITQGPVVSLGV
jgi:glycosyltransferase involved in cell wall biosynthesis